MGNLPAVADDYKNAKHTCKMMGIPPENTIAFKDASYAEVEDRIDWLCYRIGVLCRVLEDATGFYGIGFMQNGLLWTRIRESALKLKAPFESIVIDLDAEEQKELKSLIDL